MIRAPPNDGLVQKEGREISQCGDEGIRRRLSGRAGIARNVGAVLRWAQRDYGHDDIVALFLKFEDEMNILELVSHAKIDGGS